MRRLDAGLGEQIPTLREVLDLIGGRAWLNVELKARGTARLVADEIARAVEEGGSAWDYNRIVVSSFDHRELALIRGNGDPRIRIGVLVARRPVNVPKLAARFQPQLVSLHLPARLATQARVDRGHAAGLQVLVFTVNDPVEIVRLRNIGVDGVFTDFPGRVGTK